MTAWRGNCFEAAVRLQDRMEKRGVVVLVCQGQIRMRDLSHDWHAWCERDGLVYDDSNSARLANGGIWDPGPGVRGGVRGGRMIVEPIAEYYASRSVRHVRRYDRLAVAQQMVRTGNYEAWDPDPVA